MIYKAVGWAVVLIPAIGCGVAFGWAGALSFAFGLVVGATIVVYAAAGDPG